MTLPSYDRTKRRKSFARLPKGAYVIKIVSAKEEPWPDGAQRIKIAFDIAEGEYKDFYQKMFDANTNEDKKWPFDAVYSLDVPNDDSEEYKWTNWNTFFADLEDSNSGFVFKGDLKTLNGKVIGGLFRNKQTSSNGNVYDHTELKWTRPADDVRDGTYGKLPNDVIKSGSASNEPDSNGFMSIPDDAPEKLPF